MTSELKTATAKDVDTCTKSPTGEHIWNFSPRPDNCTLGICRYCEQKRVFEGRIGQHVATHTAAILNPAPVKPAVLEQAAQIAEKSLMPHRLSPGQREVINRRLKAGEDVPVVAAEYNVTPQALYKMRLKLGIRKYEVGRNTHAKPIEEVKVVAPVKPMPKSTDKVKPTQVYNNHKGNVHSQMARLRRGQIKPSSARPVLTNYKSMLEADLKATQSKAKEIKKAIEVTDEALRELDVIQQGEKAAIAKVFASVR